MSAAVGMLFFLFVFYTKELHVHPMRIIMYIAFFESIYLFLGVEQFYICDFGFHKLLSWTVFYSNDPFDVVRSIYILLYSTNFIAVFSAEMAVMLNIMLCIDLVLMVRYPFNNMGNLLIYNIRNGVLIDFEVASVSEGRIQSFDPNLFQGEN